MQHKDLEVGKTYFYTTSNSGWRDRLVTGDRATLVSTQRYAETGSSWARIGRPTDERFKASDSGRFVKVTLDRTGDGDGHMGAYVKVAHLRAPIEQAEKEIAEARAAHTAENKARAARIDELADLRTRLQGKAARLGLGAVPQANLRGGLGDLDPKDLRLSVHYRDLEALMDFAAERGFSK